MVTYEVMSKEPVYGLVCAGGGAHGAYQVGVLNYVHEHFCVGEASPFRVFCGTSAGSLNTCFFASRSYDARTARLEMQELWLGFHVPQYYGNIMMNALKSFFKELTKSRRHKKPCWSLLDPSPLVDVVGRGFLREKFERAMAQGHPKGIYWIGWYTIKGDGGILKAPLKGLELVKRSAAVATGRLRLQAYNDIGYNYSTGKYVRQDKKEGVKFYEYAAKLGLAMAQYNMGVTTTNPRQSIAWYLAAAKQGYGHASSNLGDLYARGRGVRKDLDEAERWYETAIQQGWTAAQAALTRLRNQRNK